MTQQAPSTAIFVYSKSGHSRRVAADLTKLLGTTNSEITTSLYTWPILGWIAAGRDALQGRAAPLDQPIVLPSSGLVVLVGPVWAGAPASPLNTAIDALSERQLDVAVVLTCADKKEDPSPMDKIASRLGRPLKAKLVLSNSAQGTSDGDTRLREFAETCQIGVHAA